jgi:hypothetical protein
MKKLLVVCLAVSCGSLYGAQSLFDAIKGGNWAEIKTAMESGNIKQQDSRGLTALMLAAELNNKKAVEALINAISGDLAQAKAFINKKNKYGSTALVMAAFNGNKDIVNILIAAGATDEDGEADRLAKNDEMRAILKKA